MIKSIESNLYLNLSFYFQTKLSLRMNQQNLNEQLQQNENNHLSQQNNKIEEEGKEQSNNFEQRQIEIIRSYLAELNINKNENEKNLTQIAERIQKQTNLQHKSAQEILSIIYKLLNSQNPAAFSKIRSSHQVSNSNQCDIQINESPQHSEIKPQQQIKGFRSQTSQDEGIFQKKSLFKSFNEVAQNNGFKQAESFGFAGNQNLRQENNFAGIKKINLFTKGSLDISKTGSNGFKSIGDNKFLEKQGMQIENENIQNFSFSKKGTKEFKQSSELSQFRSRRKIKPSSALLIDPSYSPQQRIQWIQSNTEECQSIVQKKLIKKGGNSSKQAFFVSEKLSQIYHEYFYSNYDRAYFSQQNLVASLINGLEFNSKRITLKEFKMVKSVLPKPKLFNIEFIISQQNKLNEFRTQLRQQPKEVHSLSQRKNEELDLSVGREVTALHPVCGHLHTGSILAIYKQNQYMVKFMRPELGTQKVLDINISTRSVSNTNKSTIENLDYESMILVLKLLEYKKSLIQQFRKYNDLIDKLKQNQQQFDNELMQEYGWIGSTINILSMGLRHIMAKFRIRGLNSSNQQLVGRNFPSLLINPLNLMSKQLQNSSEISDIQTSNQIKKIVANRSNSRIEDYIRKISLENDRFIEESQMNPEQKENMSILIKNFLGMLLHLRYEGRNFSIQSNQYLDGIQKLIDNQYTEEFNQIYANVHTIVKKIGQNQ